MPGLLHCHSEYSVRDSLIRVEDLPKLAKKHGWNAVALTDHGALEGIYAFKKACKKEGVKAIAGIEIYVAAPGEEIGERKSKSYHLTILSKSARGFSSICRQLSAAHRDHYIPGKRHAVMTYEQVLALEDVVVLSGCYSSPFWRDHPQAAADLAVFVERFGEDFFFECQALWDWEGQIHLNPVIYEMSKVFKRPIVVTPDCHFGSADDGCFHEALLAVASGKPVGSEKAWKFSTKLNYLMTPEEMQEGLSRAGIPVSAARAAIANTDLVADRCTDWDWEQLPRPEIPDVGGNLREISKAGLAALGLDGKPDYVERLNEELDVFMKAGIERYMLLVRDCLRLFKEHGAQIGPRGSVGGSLVAYTLGIATLDPVKHGLLYQRFVFPGRIGLPDIDVDVNSSFRMKVPEVLRNHFGADRVAQISNYGTFGMRQAIRDAARAYGIQLRREMSDTEYRELVSEHDKDEDNVPIEEMPTWEELNRTSPDAGAFAKMLRGRTRQFGAHAGGFVISTIPLTEGRSAVVTRGKDKALIWDMEIAEALGFVKMDFLGLDALEAVQKIETSLNVNWNDVPLDDPKVYHDLSNGLTAGVPQFLTSGLRMFLQSLKPDKFEDLVWAVAAFRPGALGQFNPRELAEQYRTNPDSLIVYQEDVMAICVYMAGFSWSEADKVRKVMAKKEGKLEWSKLTDKFADGCAKVGSIDREQAVALWGSLAECTRYVFNQAHAASYSQISYRVAWAKRNHPLETFAALLNADSDASESLKDEAPSFGVRILPPDPNYSDFENWQIVDAAILAPLAHVAGGDLRIAKAVARMRTEEMGGRFKDEEDFVARMAKLKMPAQVAPALFGRGMAGYNPLLRPVKAHWANYIETKKGCTNCELRTHCRRVVPPLIGKTNIMIVGESPGWEEDAQGQPFVGDSGVMLFGILKGHGIDREDVSITNVSGCRPQYKMIPRARAEKLILECPWVPQEVEAMKPPLILAVGRKAWEKLGGEGGITKANGTVLEKEGYRIVASVHPAFVMRDPNMAPELERAVAKFARMARELIDSAEKSGKVPRAREDMKVEAEPR